MAIIKLRRTVLGFGPEMQSDVTRSSVSGGQIGVSVPKGKAGTLSTRTNNTDGTLTLGASHGIITAQVIDLYWAGGNRRNVVVGTVAGTSVPISGGAGTNLPIATTAIVASPQVALTLGIPDTTDLVLVQRRLTFGGRTIPTINAILQLLDVGNAISTIFALVPNKGVIHDIEGGDDTDLIGASYQTGIVSNPSTVVDATFNMSWLTN